MAVDVFINYSCPFRKDGDTSHLTNLLTLRRHLEAMEAQPQTVGTVRVKVREAQAIREHVYTRTDLRLAKAKLNDVHATCESCPANLKRAFGIRGTIGCHAHVGCPLDEVAERVLSETLAENAKPERSESEQSNLIRAMVAQGGATGDRWRQLAARNPRVPQGESEAQWGTHAVATALDGAHFELTVHGLAEFLFLFPYFPVRAVEDMLSFFRSFFAVVAVYVSTPDGKLDQQRNEQFWSRSRALNELNLYIQLLKHALRLGQGVIAVEGLE